MKRSLPIVILLLVFASPAVHSQSWDTHFVFSGQNGKAGLGWNFFKIELKPGGSVDFCWPKFYVSLTMLNPGWNVPSTSGYGQQKCNLFPDGLFLLSYLESPPFHRWNPQAPLDTRYNPQWPNKYENLDLVIPYAPILIGTVFYVQAFGWQVDNTISNVSAPVKYTIVK